MPRRRALSASSVGWFSAALVVALAGVGCPEAPPGRPCDGHVDCPAGQRCDADTFFCVEVPGDGDGDAGTDAGCLCASDDDCSDPERFCDGVAICRCDRCEIQARCIPDGDAPACFQDEERCVGCLDDTHCEELETPGSAHHVCDLATMGCVLAPDAGN